jgi:hypothetical protein
MSETPEQYKIRVLEEGEDFDGLEYTQVRIDRAKHLIEQYEQDIAEQQALLAKLEEKKRKILEGKA